jgi:hypothetical protein
MDPEVAVAHVVLRNRDWMPRGQNAAKASLDDGHEQSRQVTCLDTLWTAE